MLLAEGTESREGVGYPREGRGVVGDFEVGCALRDELFVLSVS